MKLHFARFPALTAAAGLLAGLCWGQGTFATITGVVSDPTGAVVPGARVEATDVQRNLKYSAVTNELGQFTLVNLLDSTYRLTAAAAGFQTYAAGQMVLAARESRRADIELAMGTVGATVEVMAASTALETETARVSDTKTLTEMKALPMSLRRTWDFITLSPTADRTSGWEFKLAGSKSRQTDATIDGISIKASGSAVLGPFMDRSDYIQEMRLDIAQGSAESPSIGQMTVITRSGSNDVHGMIADYYDTPWFKSRNPVRDTRDTGRGHMTTWSAGGPVYIPKIYNGRNRTFFFATAELAYKSASNSNIQLTAPLDPWRTGNFSNLLNRATTGTVYTVRDPLNAGNGLPFPGNVIPANRINGVAKLMQEFYPRPNFGDATILAQNNYREVRPPATLRRHLLDYERLTPTTNIRVDQKITDKLFVFGRWTSLYWTQDAWNTAMPTLPHDQARTYQRRDMNSVAVSASYTVSPVLVNEFRWGFANTKTPNHGNIKGLEMQQKLGLKGLAPDLPDVWGMFGISFSNLIVSPITAPETQIPGGEELRQSINDTLTWLRGSHTIKMGFNLSRGTFTNRTYGNIFGSAVFGGAAGRFTTFPYADFLLGIPTTTARDFPGIFERNWRWDQGVFFTDEWKARRDLTLTYGIRWDVYRPYNEVNGRLAAFDPGSGKIVVPDGSLGLVDRLMPLRYVDVVEASAIGIPSRLINTDFGNWQPRIGLAYRPFGNDTVFRAGFGVYYDQHPSNVSMGSTVPFRLSQPNHTNDAQNPMVLPELYPAITGSGPSTVNLPAAVSRNLQVPYTLQYSLNIDHYRWGTAFRIGYIGTGMRQGLYTRNINQPVADSRPFIQKPRPFPQYPGINYRDNGTGHQYHSLTLQATRRYRNGLSYAAYWTWARDIENGIGEDANGGFERFVAADFPRHRVSANLVYELPFGRGKRWGAGRNRLADAVFGGWSISNIYSLEPGRYLTPTYTLADPTGTQYTTSGTRPAVSRRPDQIASADISDRTIDRWFNVQAFAPPALGAFGNSARGVIRGAPLNVMHTALMKTFPIRERARFVLQLLANNSLNHLNLADPNTTVSVAAAGTIVNVKDRNARLDSAIPRVFMLHGRLEW